jgi:hypothetical protein
MFFPSHGADATRRRRAQAGFSELRAAGLTIRTSNFELRTTMPLNFAVMTMSFAVETRPSKRRKNKSEQ